MAESADIEKKIRNLKKKLGQIEKLKEKDPESLDADAREKLASESDILAEIKDLEHALKNGGAMPVAPAKPAKAAAKPAAAPAPEPAAFEPAERQGGANGQDPNFSARAQALEPPPGDVGLLIDEETEKRFKALQKKLRDIGSLRKKQAEGSKLDKLQEDKLVQEQTLIQDIQIIRSKATKLVDERRAKYAASAQAAEKAEKAEAGPRPDWQCNECGASGSSSQLDCGEGVSACPKCGSDRIQHNAPNVSDDEDEEEEVGGKDTSKEPADKTGKKESKDLKTSRQKKAAAPLEMGAKLAAAYAGNVSSGAARWPEVKEVLESGEGGTDRSRQKKAILVSQAKAVAPYDSFDSTLLKCNFLTRVELKLAPGVLSAEGFMLYFPGSLCENLLELILKDSGLEKVPPGLKELQRIRSVDLSRNAIDVLPSQDVWKGVSGSLELLDLSFNKLTSIAELSPLTKLSQLKVDGNLLTSLNGVSWKESKQLATLSAVANQITEISEEVGEHAASLEYFELTDNKLTVVPPNIAECKKLKTLSIAGNPIKDQKVVKAAEKGMKDIKAYLSKIGGGKKR